MANTPPTRPRTTGPSQQSPRAKWATSAFDNVIRRPKSPARSASRTPAPFNVEARRFKALSIRSRLVRSQSVIHTADPSVGDASGDEQRPAYFSDSQFQGSRRRNGRKSSLRSILVRVDANGNPIRPSSSRRTFTASSRGVSYASSGQATSRSLPGSQASTRPSTQMSNRDDKFLDLLMSRPGSSASRVSIKTTDYAEGDEAIRARDAMWNRVNAISDRLNTEEIAFKKMDEFGTLTDRIYSPSMEQISPTKKAQLDEKSYEGPPTAISPFGQDMIMSRAALDVSQAREALEAQAEETMARRDHAETVANNEDASAAVTKRGARNHPDALGRQRHATCEWAARGYKPAIKKKSSSAQAIPSTPQTPPKKAGVDPLKEYRFSPKSPYDDPRDSTLKMGSMPGFQDLLHGRQFVRIKNMVDKTPAPEDTPAPEILAAEVVEKDETISQKTEVRAKLFRTHNLLQKTETYLRSHEKLDIKIPKEKMLKRGKDLYDVSDDEEDPFSALETPVPQEKSLLDPEFRRKHMMDVLIKSRKSANSGSEVNQSLATIVAAAKIMKKVKKKRILKSQMANYFVSAEEENSKKWKPRLAKTKQNVNSMWGKLKKAHGVERENKIRSDQFLFHDFVDIVRRDFPHWAHRGPPIIHAVMPKFGDLRGGTALELAGLGFPENLEPEDVEFRPLTEQVNDIPLETRTAATLHRLSDHRLLITSPPGMYTSKYQVVVKTNGLESPATPSCIFRYTNPRIIQVHPKQVPCLKPSSLDIIGYGLGTSADEDGLRAFIGESECKITQVPVPGKQMKIVIPPDLPFGDYHVSIHRHTEVDETVRSDTHVLRTLVKLSDEPVAVVVSDTKKLKEDIGAVRIEIDIRDLFQKSSEPDVEMKSACKYLVENLYILRQTFYYYAMEAGTAGEDDPNDMGKRQFFMFVEDSRFAGKHAVGPEYPMASADIVFIRANREYEAEDDNDDNALVFHEFMAAFVRLAHGKYRKAPTMEARLKMAMDLHIVPYAVKLADQRPFLHAVGDSDVQALISKYNEALQTVFNYYSGQDGSSLDGSGTMNWNEFQLLKEDCKLPDIPEAQLRNAYAKTNIGEWKDFPMEHPCVGVCICPPKSTSIRVLDLTKKRKKPKKIADAALDPTELGFDEMVELIFRIVMIAQGMGDDEDPSITSSNILPEILPCLKKIEKRANEIQAFVPVVRK